MQQLGLDSSCSRREKTIDDVKSKNKPLKDSPKFTYSGKRKKMIVEAPQPKRRKPNDTRVGKVTDGVPEQLHGQHSESTETKLITGRDMRYINLVCTSCATCMCTSV